MDVIVKYAIKRAHYRVKQLIGSNGFTEADFRDLRQELVADVLQRLHNYRGDRSAIKTFICRLIDNRIANLVDYQTAHRRDPDLNECSLDEWVPGEDGTWVQRHTVIDEDCARAHTGQAPRSREDRLDLSLDLAAVVAALPQELRCLCERLQSQTVAEIAREMGTSRHWVYRRIEMIRAVFIEAGLTCYLRESGTPAPGNR